MIGDLYDTPTNPRQERFSRIVVRDDFGNPIAVFLQHGTSKIWMKTCLDPDFNTQLQTMGIKGTTFVERLDNDKKRQIVLPGDSSSLDITKLGL